MFGVFCTSDIVHPPKEIISFSTQEEIVKQKVDLFCMDGKCNISSGENIRGHENCCAGDCPNIPNCEMNSCEGLSISNVYYERIESDGVDVNVFRLNLCNNSPSGQDFPFPIDGLLSNFMSQIRYQIHGGGYNTIGSSVVSPVFSTYGGIPLEQLFFIPNGECRMLEFDFPYQWPIGDLANIMFSICTVDIGINIGNRFTGVCGDGIITQNNANGYHEDCDDGNTISGDGCDESCESEICLQGLTCDSNQDCRDGICEKGGSCIGTYISYPGGSEVSCSHITTQQGCSNFDPYEGRCDWFPISEVGFCDCR